MRQVYLSRLVLDPTNRMVWRDLGDCQQMHKTIMKAFPIPSGVKSPRSRHDILYRLEITTEGRIVLYVQSAIKPDWSHLLEDGYLLTDCGLENPAVKSIDEQLARIKEGMILRFRLKGNPTKKVGTSTKTERLAEGKKDNGRRVALLGEQAQIEWLARKGAASGFRLLSVRASSEVPDIYTGGRSLVKGRKPSEGSGEPLALTFRGVIFDGHLVVTDREAFLAAVRKGIGSGKAYGFGLLSLAGA